MSDIEALIKIAEDEIEYLEKKSKHLKTIHRRREI
jgi:hypothetical protein